MSVVNLVLPLTCSDPVKCSEHIVKEMETKFNLILKPKVQDGDHNGFVDIIHTPGAHEIKINVFDSTDNSKHKKKGNMPKKKEIQEKIALSK